MGRLRFNLGILPLLLVVALGMGGCHADEDDPKGQAEELADPVRREHAISRLRAIFGQRLMEAKGDREAAPVQEFKDATAQALNDAYLAYPEDSVNGLKMLEVMEEIRDPRTVPALVKALAWEKNRTEEHATTASRTLTAIELPAADKSKVVAALSDALGRVEGSDGVENRMRKAFIEALGKMEDKASSPALVKVMLRQDGQQNFLFNILAGQQLVPLSDPTNTAPFIQALDLFAPDNPAMRMNDVAASGLVAIGRPALEPLLATLEGKNEDANALAKAYIEAVRSKDPAAAESLSVEGIVAGEAAYTLGKLGFPEAVDPLIQRTKVDDAGQAFAMALPLVSVHRQPDQTPAIFGAMLDVYKRLDKQQKPQMLVAMRHLYAEEMLPFLLKVARTPEKEMPPIQLYGFVGYAMLADKAESQPLKQILEKQSNLAPMLKDYKAAIAAAEACDRNVGCWTQKLKDEDTLVVRKAINMLARLGRGNKEAIASLVELFGHHDLEVRNEALYAVDHMAEGGSESAVAKIEALEKEEGGRSIWNNFKREALPMRDRLVARARS